MGRLKTKGKLQRSRQLRIIMGYDKIKEPKIIEIFCGAYRTKKTQLSTEVVQLRCVCSQSCPALGTPSTVAHQASLSMDLPRQEYWSV